MARNWSQFQKGCTVTHFLDESGREDEVHAGAVSSALRAWFLAMCLRPRRT